MGVAQLSPVGPATEARLSAAFAEGALITADAAARILGLDVKTLRALTENAAIRSVPVGKVRRPTKYDAVSFRPRTAGQ